MTRYALILVSIAFGCGRSQLVPSLYTASVAYTAEQKKYLGDEYRVFISDTLVWIKNNNNVHTYPITLVKGRYNLYSPPLYKIYFNQSKKYLQVKHRVKSTNIDHALPNESYDLLYWVDGLKLVEIEGSEKKAD